MTRKWLWLVAPWALFVVLAIGWVSYWFVVAGTAERRLNDWVAAQNAAGAQAAIGRVVRHGFPVLLRLELQDVRYTPARGGWGMSTARVDLHIQLLNTEHIIFEAEAPIMVTRENGARTQIVADALIASVRTENGALAVAGVETDNLQLDDQAQEGVFLARKLVLNARHDPRATGDYQVALDAQGIVLPRPVRSFESFGLDVNTLRAAIVVTQGATLMQGAHADPLGPWREAGGRFRFEALTLAWGPLEADGRGEGGLDDERRIEGALEIPIDRPAPVFNAIANGPNVDRDAKRALALLAAGYAISGDDITLDVEAGDGWLRIEGLSVRPLGPVY
jgi:hypothetical protein